MCETETLVRAFDEERRPKIMFLSANVAKWCQNPNADRPSFVPVRQSPLIHEKISSKVLVREERYETKNKSKTITNRKDMIRGKH